jgi:hypothetical protein
MLISSVGLRTKLFWLIGQRTGKLISHDRFCLLGQSLSEDSFGNRASEEAEVIHL